MKLLDKYLLRTLLVPLVYCLLAFVMITIVFDLFDNLPDFIEGKTPMLLVLKYYLILLPSVLVRIVPISLLCAVLYSLYSMTRSNELTAMRVSGLSMSRLMLPFIIVGFCMSLAVATIHESVGPKAAFWCRKFISQQRKTGHGVDVYQVSNLALSRPAAQRMWYVNDFNMRSFEMNGIQVIQRRPDGRSEEYKLLAKTGRWIDGRWWFSEIQTQNYDEWGNPKGPPRFELSRPMNNLTESPRDFLNEIKDPGLEPELFSARELYAYVSANPEREPRTLARITADLHSRLAMPWACLIVTLLGVPFGNQTGRKGALVGIGLVLLMFLGYYGLTLIGLWMAKESIVPAWLGGWLPNMTFLVVSLVMVFRMR